MTGHSRFSGLTSKLPPERQERIGMKTAEILEEMSMAELRQALDRTQSDLAKGLGVSQPAVARMERRSDMHVSSLRRVIETLGGELEIRAKFRHGTVTITNFSAEEDSEAKPSS